MTKKESQAMIAGIISPKLTKEEQAIITTPKIQLPEGSGGHLSPTQIEMYLRCPRQYCSRYVEGKKFPPGVAMVEGKTHHCVFEHNNKHKIKKGSDYSLKPLFNFFHDSFNEYQGEIPKKEWMRAGETKDKVLNRGKELLAKYLSKFAGRLTPWYIERELRFKVGDVEVLGYLDVAGEVQPALKKSKANPPRYSVIDYKVVSRKKTDAELQNAIGLSFYGWGAIDLFSGIDMLKNPPDVGFCSLTKTQQPDVHWQSVVLQVGRIKWFRRVVLDIANCISQGSFPVCNPVTWCCTDRFCGYYKQCKGKVVKR